ncbi:MAG: TlpA disulfide reductase family protein [Verrucomicrobiales bacterium]
MKSPLACLLVASLSLQIVSGESAREIASRFEKEKVEAIEKYLDENPEAEDTDAALAILVGANLSMGRFDPIPDLLLKRYEMQPKGPDANLNLIFNEVARPFIESAVVSDQRDKAKAFVTRMKSDFADHPQSAQIDQGLDQLGASLYLPGVGDEMTFAFTDLQGNEVDLAEMDDKVVLVDFWATWCAPCIAEMPNVIAAYNEYHEEGFEIVGVSLDEDKAALEKFVTENDMPWPQYFDGKGFNNELAQRFGISQIPATFLVGQDGKIVASNLRGPELEAAVEKALGIEGSAEE